MWLFLYGREGLPQSTDPCDSWQRSIHFQVKQVTFPAERAGAGGLINYSECYLQFRLCFIWVSLGSGALPFTERGVQI